MEEPEGVCGRHPHGSFYPVYQDRKLMALGVLDFKRTIPGSTTEW